MDVLRLTVEVYFVNLLVVTLILLVCSATLIVIIAVWRTVMLLPFMVIVSFVQSAWIALPIVCSLSSIGLITLGHHYLDSV